MFNRFINYENPIGSITATLNITRLIKFNKKGHKINALINFCILKAANRIKEFHYYYENKNLYYSDLITMMGVVKGKDNYLYLAKWSYFDNYLEFEKNYLNENSKVYSNNKSSEFKDTAILSSSAFIDYPLDSAVVEMGKDITHTYFTWGGYKKSFFKYYQSITLRFHHAFMDGGHISLFYKFLQEEINNFKLI